MENSDAIKVLVQVAIAAQAKGILTLEEAVIVKNSIDSLLPLIQEPTEKVEKVE